MNKLVSDGSVKKINYPVLYESGITPPLYEVSAPEPDAGGKRIVAYVYKSSRAIMLVMISMPELHKTLKRPAITLPVARSVSPAAILTIMLIPVWISCLQP